MSSVINLEPDSVYIDSQFLYDKEADLNARPPFEPARLATLKSQPGRLFEFECFIPAWPGLRDKLPISSIRWKVVEDDGITYYPAQMLQRWECFDLSIFAIKKTVVEASPVEVTMVADDGSRIQAWGIYRYTIDTHPSSFDLAFVSDPGEHKSFNLIQLDNGQYALLPNNQCRFAPPSLVECPLPPLSVRPRVADEIYYPGRQGVNDPSSYLYEVSHE